jgi:alginate O-acetyltransferase complex protein AlgI
LLFNSYPFVFGFLPILIAGYAILSATRMRKVVPLLLVAASLAFYAWWNWRYLLLFFCSIVFNYAWGSLIRGPSPERDERMQRRIVGIGVAVNLAILGYFKYRNFFIEDVGGLFGLGVTMAPLVLPLAISFFTFEQITYLVGIYRGEAGERDFLTYALFITFFPHLIAGPIVRYHEIAPQLNRHSRFQLNADNLSLGLMIFAFGLFKKVVLADTVRSWVGPIYDGSGAVLFGDAWGATIAFTLQIYFDFSGYSDMAIGLARIFNVRFPENFDSPYQSGSIIEFWRRWHITLSFFLRDYLYIPLGGNRHGELRRYLNMFATMLLGGLWHGANWTFVVWGAIHGGCLAINHLWCRLNIRTPVLLSWLITFATVVIAWVFFRAQTFHRAGEILSGMAGVNGFSPVSPTRVFGGSTRAKLLIGLALVLICPNRQTILAWEWNNDYIYATVFAMLAGVSLLMLANPPPFIYFQF